MSQKKNNNLKYLFITLCITCSLFFLKKSSLFDTVTLNPLRNLFFIGQKSYICRQAGQRLKDKYRKGFNEVRKYDTSLSKAQRSLIDFGRDNSYSNIKPYIRRCGIFIAILVIDVILIFMWISYCGCCCCKCCLFGRPQSNNSFSFISFIIAAFLCLLVIIFSIVVLALIKPFYRRINGVGCSTFYLIDHVRYGLAPNYPYLKDNWDDWEGINGIINILNKTKEESDAIIGELRTISTPSLSSNDCKETFEVDSDKETINGLVDSSFKIDFSGQIKDLNSAKKDFDDVDNDIGNDFYDILHDYINGHAKRTSNAIFSLTLIFGLLGLIILILYHRNKYNYYRIAYIVIWNISMFLMLFAILMSVVFGVVGYLLKDGAKVGQYILSTDNLNSTDPLLIKSGNQKYISDLVDICANGNGSFTSIIQESGKLNENIEKYKENVKKYNKNIERIYDLDEGICTADEKIKLLKYYKELTNIGNQAINISGNLTDINCAFAKNDKNIILNEATSGGNRALVLCAFSFIVGALLGLSVLFGILYVHKYGFNSYDNRNVKDITINNVNESSANIGGENNVENINNINK